MATKKELHDALVTLVGALDRQCLDQDGRKFTYSLNVNGAIIHARELLTKKTLEPPAVDDVMRRTIAATPRNEAA